MIDQISQLAHDLNVTDSLAIPMALSEHEKQQIAGLEGEKLWRWLEENQRKDVIRDLVVRQVGSAVIADAAIFLSESLLACAKDKTTVAYSLLRKPIKENLLLLEWLCSDPRGFFESFYSGSGERFLLDGLPLDRRREIIKNAVEATNTCIADDELLWLLRFGKSYPRSFETMWTLAAHLVTSKKASATEAGNLNFVFSSKTAILDQWDHYYSNPPLLLMYFLDVVETFVSGFFEWEDKQLNIRILRRNIGYMRLAQTLVAENSKDFDSESELKILAESVMKCSSCERENSLSCDFLDRVWLRGEIVCKYCGWVQSLWEAEI